MRNFYFFFIFTMTDNVAGTLMSKMVMMITTVRTIEIKTVTQYLNLHHPFSLTPPIYSFPFF